MIINTAEIWVALHCRVCKVEYTVYDTPWDDDGWPDDPIKKLTGIGMEFADAAAKGYHSKCIQQEAANLGSQILFTTMSIVTVKFIHEWTGRCDMDDPEPRSRGVFTFPAWEGTYGDAFALLDDTDTSYSPVIDEQLGRM